MADSHPTARIENSSIATRHIYTCQNLRGVRSCILIRNEERINWAYQISDSHLFSSSYRENLSDLIRQTFALGFAYKMGLRLLYEALKGSRALRKKHTCASSSSEVKVGPEFLLFVFIFSLEYVQFV